MSEKYGFPRGPSSAHPVNLDAEPIPDALRSAAWAEAKPAAIAEWQRGSADSTQMLRAASRAVDATLRLVVPELRELRAKIDRQAAELHAKDMKILELRERLRLIHNEAARGLSSTPKATVPPSGVGAGAVGAGQRLRRLPGGE